MGSPAPVVRSASTPQYGRVVIEPSDGKRYGANLGRFRSVVCFPPDAAAWSQVWIDPLAAEATKQSGQVTRLLRRLHVHHLIAKIPRSRRWRVSLNGRRVMAAAVKLREVAYPSLYAEAA